MQTINVSDAEAEAGLVWLSQHVPVAVQLGRPQVALRDTRTADGNIQYLTDAGMLWATKDGAQRLLYADDGVELTDWRDGMCTSVSFGDLKH